MNKPIFMNDNSEQLVKNTEQKIIDLIHQLGPFDKLEITHSQKGELRWLHIRSFKGEYPFDFYSG